MDGNWLTRVTQVNDPSYMQPTQQRSQQPKRERISTIDVIGSVLDGIASMGGSEPMYQSTLDARAARERQAEQDQMTRELFPIEKQKGILGNQKAQQEMMYDQNEVLGLAASYVQRGYQNGGVQGALNVFDAIGPRVLPLEQYQAEREKFAANPEGYISALSVFTGMGAGSAELGLQPFYVTNADGSVSAYQLGKDGVARKIELGPGETPAPPVTYINQGTQIQPMGTRSAVPVGPALPVAGKPAEGYVPVQDGGGRPTGEYMEAPGSKAAVERIDAIDKELTTLRGVRSALEFGKAQMANVDAALETMKEKGGLTGVEGQDWRDNATAQVYQRLPFVERTFNPPSASARKEIDSIATSMMQSLTGAIQQASGVGVNLSARLIDTPKEVQLLKDAIVNSTDYTSARNQFELFKQKIDTAMKDIDDQIKKAEAKRSSIGKPQRSQEPAPPSVSNW